MSIINFLLSWIVFSITTGSLTALSGTDFLEYTLPKLTFSAGQVQFSFYIVITDDEFIETNEKFTVTMAASDPDVALDIETATVTIIDDDIGLYSYHSLLMHWIFAYYACGGLKVFIYRMFSANSIIHRPL
jgi:hypothetical protein